MRDASIRDPILEGKEATALLNHPAYKKAMADLTSYHHSRIVNSSFNQHDIREESYHILKALAELSNELEAAQYSGINAEQQEETDAADINLITSLES